MTLDVKICGLKTPDAVQAAVDGGTRSVGFVFFGPSPRNLDVAEAAALMALVPDGVTKVALSVDADDALLDAIAAETPVDMMQFHGSESPARVLEIKQRTGLAVMKAIAVAGADDLEKIAAYADAADQLLFDAKPPKGATRPGGNALVFDWELIRGADIPLPWMLAGGLNIDNLAEAVRISGAGAVDISSGVEDAPGVKNPQKIKDLLAFAASL